MEVEKETILDASRRILAASKYGFVTTQSDGKPAVRMVQHLEVTPHLELTFSTGRHTRKAKHIEENPNSLVYAASNPNTGAAVCLYGPAVFVFERERLESAWLPELAPFFPNGPEGGEFVLITIQTQRVEVWSAGDKIHPAPFGLSSSVLTRSGEDWLGPDVTHP